MKVASFNNQLWDLLREISENLDQAFHPVIEEYGLTLMQVRILMEISQNANHTIGSISSCVCVMRGNMSNMCKRLEAEGLLERSRNKEDERVVTLSLTKKGQDTIDKITNDLQDKYGSALKGESEEVMTDIIGGLKKLNSLLIKFKKIDTKEKESSHETTKQH